MKIVIDIPDAPIEDYQDLYSKIYGMAASEGLFDDKVKSQRALALKVVLEVLDGIVNGTPLPKGHRGIVDLKSVQWAFDDAILEEAQKTGQVRATHDEIASILETVPTIIDADDAESEKV